MEQFGMIFMDESIPTDALDLTPTDIANMLFDDLVQSGLTSPEIEEIASRLLVKSAQMI